MVNKKIYLRIGKHDVNRKYRVDASFSPSAECLWSSNNRDTNKALATVHFAIEVEIPDEKFEMEKMATAKINFDLEENRLLVKAVDKI